MSDQTSVFDEQNKQEAETPQEPQTSPFDDQLKSIVNEAGEQKYKDINTALEALKSSQEFIRKLKEEKTQLEQTYNKTKSELEKMGTIDDYVNRLKPDATETQPKETPEGVGGLSEEQVAAILERTLSQREQQSAAQANLQKVEEELVSTHGEKAPEFIKQRASELNMSVADLKNLSSSSPAAALSLLGVEVKKPVVPTQSNVIPPRESADDNPLPTFDRSVAHGGLTNRDLVERLNQVRQYTYKRYGVKA